MEKKYDFDLYESCIYPVLGEYPDVDDYDGMMEIAKDIDAFELYGRPNPGDYDIRQWDKYLADDEAYDMGLYLKWHLDRWLDDKRLLVDCSDFIEGREDDLRCMMSRGN